MKLKSTQVSSATDPILSGYMTYLPDEGLDFAHFVRRGGQLITPGIIAALRNELPELREKISAIGVEHPELGQQLEFLARFLESEAQEPGAGLPDPMLNEAAFALLYAARDMDLTPDDMPGIGYSDDSAVVQIVLESHANSFERICKEQRIPWSELRPQPES